jgi:hypothetical protein
VLVKLSQICRLNNIYVWTDDQSNFEEFQGIAVKQQTHLFTTFLLCDACYTMGEQSCFVRGGGGGNLKISKTARFKNKFY